MVDETLIARMKEAARRAVPPCSYMAASYFLDVCSPANILAFTKRVEELEAENARLRAANDPNHYSRAIEAAIAEDGP